MPRPARMPNANCCPSSVPSMWAIREAWRSPTRSLEITDGEGVDVVLNSLAGRGDQPGRARYWRPVAGSSNWARRTSTPTPVWDWRRWPRARSFSVVDLDLNLRMRPKHYRRMLQDILAHAAVGDLEPLPVTDFDFDHVIDAFRLMASGGTTPARSRDLHAGRRQSRPLTARRRSRWCPETAGTSSWAAWAVSASSPRAGWQSRAPDSWWSTGVRCPDAEVDGAIIAR